MEIVKAAAEEHRLESTSVPCLSFFGSDSVTVAPPTPRSSDRSPAAPHVAHPKLGQTAGPQADGRTTGGRATDRRSFSASKALLSTNDFYSPRLRICSGHHGRGSCHCVHFLGYGRTILTTRALLFLFPFLSCDRTTLRPSRTPPPASSLSPPARLSPELHPPAPLRCAPQLPLAHLSHHLSVCSTCRADIHQSLGRLDLPRPGGAH